MRVAIRAPKTLPDLGVGGSFAAPQARKAPEEVEELSESMFTTLPAGGPPKAPPKAPPARSSERDKAPLKLPRLPKLPPRKP